MAQVPLNKLLPAIDRKDREFYDNLPEDEKKGLSGYLAMRWLSYTKGSPDLEDYCLRSTNLRANKHIFSLSRHPKLQWLMVTAASPGIGKLNHSWIKGIKKTKSADEESKKILLDLYPAMKEDDINAWSKLIDKKDLKQYVRDRGE